MRAFVRLVENTTFRAVARELGVTQPTVTKWLTALEEGVGARLLDRSTRSRRVTEEGRRFYEHAREIISRFDEARADVSRERQGLTGGIVVNLPVVLGKRHLLRPCIEFLALHPGIQMELSFSDEYLRLIESGFDLAVRVGEMQDSTLRSFPIGATERKLVASPRYLAKHGLPQGPDCLRKHQCLVLGRGRTAVWKMRRSGHSLQVPVGGRVVASDSEAVLDLALEAFGIARLGAFLVDRAIREGQLVQLLPEYTLSRAPIVGLTPPGQSPSRRVRSLLEHLRASWKVQAQNARHLDTSVRRRRNKDSHPS